MLQLWRDPNAGFTGLVDRWRLYEFSALKTDCGLTPAGRYLDDDDGGVINPSISDRIVAEVAL